MKTKKRIPKKDLLNNLKRIRKSSKMSVLNLTDKELDELEKGMKEFRESFKFDFRYFGVK